MSEKSAFKNLINPRVVGKLAGEISSVYPAFDRKGFSRVAKELAPLELKARVLLIADRLKTYLPEAYPKALSVLVSVLEETKLEGLALWPFSEFIGRNGLGYFDSSMRAMHLLTQKFTSEFAVRPYFLKDPEKTLGYFRKWSSDKNVHVRRWVSEGSRPLLPWGARLPVFIADPSPTLALLGRLKFDEELYVRKSVANHLNDISKHHPKKVIETLVQWALKCPPVHLEKLEWIKRQALRTLIKKGDPEALRLMGVASHARVRVGDLSLRKSRLRVGEKLEFEFEITSTAKTKQKLVVDYLVHFVKSNGDSKAKVFKLKTFQIAPREQITLSKSHSLKRITTMVYYPGRHRVSIQVNGKIFVTQDWDFRA